jgi:predicted TIM-barrel fold metal-dependent hydrolase
MALLCSADSHVHEPNDLWTERLPKALRPSAMRWEYLDAGPKGQLQHTWVADHAGEDAHRWMTVQRPVSADGMPLEGGIEERTKALDADGVWAELLLANIGMHMFNVTDGELAMGYAEAYNDYMAETYAPHRDRFVPLAAVPLHDVDWAIREIEKGAERGLRGAMLPVFVNPWYASDVYEPMWAALQANKMTATFHAATGFDAEGGGMFRQVAQMGFGNFTENEVDAFKCYSGAPYGLPAERLISTLVGAGICERYPDLKFVSAENNAHWLASLIGVMELAWMPSVRKTDDIWLGMWNPDNEPENQPMMQSFGAFQGKWKYPLRPRDYVRRQIRCTFMDDPMAIACREITGVEPLMWAADYPHPESTYPDSKRVVDVLCEGISEEDRYAITCGNFAELYDIEVPATVEASVRG